MRVKSQRSKSFGGTDKWQRKDGGSFQPLLALVVMTPAPLEDEKVRVVYSVRKSILGAMYTSASKDILRSNASRLEAVSKNLKQLRLI